MLDNFKSCKYVIVVDAVHHSFLLCTLRKQVVEINIIGNVSIVKNIVSHGSTQLTNRENCVTEGFGNVHVEEACWWRKSLGAWAV
jgi:hypothetical protein